MVNKYIGLIGSLVLFFSILGGFSFFKINSNETSTPKTENVVQAKGVIKAEVEVFEFEDAVNKSDVIAEVKIQTKKKELNDPSPKTIFEAKVKEGYKGIEKNVTINILQQGNSEWIFNENKLFSANEEYVLFLKKAVGEEFEGTNTYWILGEETNIYSSINDKEVLKNSYYDTVLADIENKSLTEEYKKKEKKDVQVLGKEQLKEKIKMVTKE